MLVLASHLLRIVEARNTKRLRREVEASGAPKGDSLRNCCSPTATIQHERIRRDIVPPSEDGRLGRPLPKHCPIASAVMRGDSVSAGEADGTVFLYGRHLRHPRRRIAM